MIKKLKELKLEINNYLYTLRGKLPLDKTQTKVWIEGGEIYEFDFSIIKEFQEEFRQIYETDIIGGIELPDLYKNEIYRNLSLRTDEPSLVIVEGDIENDTKDVRVEDWHLLKKVYIIYKYQSVYKKLDRLINILLAKKPISESKIQLEIGTYGIKKEIKYKISEKYLRYFSDRIKISDGILLIPESEIKFSPLYRGKVICSSKKGGIVNIIRRDGTTSTLYLIYPTTILDVGEV